MVGGELDRVLARPVSSLLQARLELAWGPWDVLAVTAATLGAWLVYGGVYVTVASLSFWTQERGAGLFPVAHNAINFGRHPLDVYPAMVRFLLTFGRALRLRRLPAGGGGAAAGVRGAWLADLAGGLAGVRRGGNGVAAAARRGGRLLTRGSAC